MGIIRFSKEIFKLYPLHITLAGMGLLASSLLEVFGIASLLPVMAGMTSGETILHGGAVGRVFDFLGLSSLSANHFLFAVVGFMLLRSITLFFSSYIMGRLSVATEKTMKRKLMNAALHTKWPFFLRQNTGQVVNIINAHTGVVGHALHSMSNFYIPLILSIVFFIVSLLVSFYSFMIALCLAIPLFAISHYINKKTRAISKKLVVATNKCGTEIVENMNQAKYIKAHAIEQAVTGRFADITGRIAALGAKNVLMGTMMSVIPELLIVIVLTLLIAFIYNFQQGQVWDFVFFLMVMLRAYQYLSRAQQYRQILSTQIPSYEVCMDLLKEAEDAREDYATDSEQFEFTKEITLNNTSFSYPTGKQILHNVSLTIPKDSLTAFVGRSGAGKTTIIDMIIGLLHPSEGSVSVDGQNLKEINLRQWREKIAYVPQDAMLFNDTVRNNITRDAAGTSEDDMLEAARKAHAAQFIMEMNDGYDTVVGDRGIKLSGGQKQRIALARALIRKPKILILDEATSALDNESERYIHTAINELRKDMTIILIAHRLTTVMNCDKIFVIDGGTLAEQGAFEELKEKGGVFSDIYEGG